MVADVRRGELCALRRSYIDLTNRVLRVPRIPTGSHLDPDCSRPRVPDSVTQHYERLMARLGIDSTLRKLRHYNTTELLAVDIDLRTAAGRLGHSGGGTTTLHVHAAWFDEADRRAAETLAERPPRPGRT